MTCFIMLREADGRPVMSKTGHAFIKERMRAENALYGGRCRGITTFGISPIVTAA